MLDIVLHYIVILYPVKKKLEIWWDFHVELEIKLTIRVVIS